MGVHDCIIISYSKVKFGKLTSCFKISTTDESFLLIQKLERFLVSNIPIWNELDCQLIEETHRHEVISSMTILGSISIVHQCGSSCTVTHTQTIPVEREQVLLQSTQGVKHDRNNKMYCINSYSKTLFSTVTT